MSLTNKIIRTCSGVFIKKLPLLLPVLLLLSVTGLFFTSWNSYLNQSGSLFIPVLFLASSYLLIIIILFRNNNTNSSPIKKFPEENEETIVKGSAEEEKDSIPIPVNYKELAERLIGVNNHGDPVKNARQVLVNFASEFNIMQGVFYSFNPEEKKFSMTAAYALAGNNEPEPFEPGKGIHGQAVIDKKLLELSNLPEDFTIVLSGLGSTYGRFLYLVPFIKNNETNALVEFTVFHSIGQEYMNALNKALPELGDKWIQINENIRKNK